MDYDKLFEHVANLRKVLLIAAGRSGSDFFQSLLDGHPQILQFTGIWYFYPFWNQAKCKENLPDLIEEFIWYSTSTCMHIAKFKSFYNKHERWDQLGPNKDESFEVDIQSFRNHMLHILGDRALTSKNFFFAVNLAYGLATQVDIEKTKILFYHIHHMGELKRFWQEFPEFDVICTTREPRNTLVSNVEHFRDYYDVSKYSPDFLYRILKRLLEEAGPAAQYARSCKTLKLEDLHLHSREVLEEFCKTYGLQFEECMFESSYQGKKWWGDMLSGRYLDGFNKNITKVNWKDKLFLHDSFLIEFILEQRLRRYGYVLEHNASKIMVVCALLLALLPMKYELKILAFNFKHRTSLRGKVYALVHSTRFYWLRICLYLKFMRHKMTNQIFAADFFLQERYSAAPARCVTESAEGQDRQ